MDQIFGNIYFLITFKLQYSDCLMDELYDGRSW